MKLLYEDKYLIICVKPVGILSQPGQVEGEDMISLLKTYQKDKNEEDYIGLVHRLDRNVGGVMVFSKQPAMTGKLSSLIQERNFTKEYLAVVHGCLEETSGVYQDLLFKDSSKNKSYVVKRLRKGVKEASLAYELIDVKNTDHEKLSLIKVCLHTGRTHQIRVQFSSRRMPLLGDGKYGSKDNRCDTALWSYRISFSHPINHEIIDVRQLPSKEYPWDMFEYSKL